MWEGVVANLQINRGRGQKVFIYAPTFLALATPPVRNKKLTVITDLKISIMCRGSFILFFNVVIMELSLICNGILFHIFVPKEKKLLLEDSRFCLGRIPCESIPLLYL